MRNPKRLTRTQKECVSAHYLKADEWALIEETDFYYKIINKKTGQKKSIDKFRRQKRR